jgi:predicted ATPase
MITRIEVDGFKSLRDFAMDLEPFTVLIGPNSAGKSNIVDALALLSRLASQPIIQAFKSGRGRIIDQFTRRGGEPVREMRFAVEFLEYGRYPRDGRQDEQSRFRYELTIERQPLSSGAESLVVGREVLRALRPESDTWIASHSKFAPYARYEDAGNAYFITMKEENAKRPRVITLPNHDPEERRVPSTHTALAALDGPYYVDLVRRDLARWQLLHVDRGRLGEPSERIESGELAPDGSNLPTILAELPDSILGEIRADLVSLVPGIASFDVVPEGDTVRLDFELSGGERLPARLISDGTLRILVLLAALRMEPLLLCVEEPENGIYPGRLRALLELLRETTERHHLEPESDLEKIEWLWQMDAVHPWVDLVSPQLLLTSHSPITLATLRTRPEHLRFIDVVRRDGERVTRARPVARPGTTDRGRTAISPREIAMLLDAVQSEEPG